MNKLEALSLVKKEWSKESLKPIREALLVLVPSLEDCEDEDEIHRKWILEYLYDGLRKADEQFKDHFKAAIDWLEKQKVQKPILEVSGFKVGDAVRLKDGDGRKHIIKSFEEVEGLHGRNFYHVKFEDNSATDNIYPGEEYPNGYYTKMEKIEEEQKTFSSYDMAKCFVEGQDYVIRHPEKFGLQKPAEWSEEDKRMLERVINSQKHVIPVPGKRGLEDMTTREEEDTEAIKWLRELPSRIRPVQEWSEEDDQYLLVCKNALQKYQSSDKWDANIIYNWLEKRLKSLRPQPHWKPSDAQIQALEFVLEYHVFANPQNKEHINSLYRALKNYKPWIAKGVAPKWLYRLEFKDASCGLWYDGSGKWCFDSGIGAISGCKTKTLPMGFDERYKQDGRDWFSSCSNKEDLMHWYSLEDAKELISKGFVFTRYLATEYHEYDQQTVFIKDTALYREEIDIFELFGKSTGWSDEDEEMIARICANLEYLVKEAGCDYKLRGKLEERIKWMERLKSRGCPKTSDNWKPSEKQIEALEWQVHNTSEGSWQRNETETLLKAIKEIML